MAQEREFDFIVIGAGSGGLTAAGFAAQLGVRVALIEKHRVGGDCTWTGCVPSKALLKAAKVAHEVRTARRYGIGAGPPAVDMAGVRAYVRGAIERVYDNERPEQLREQGLTVILGEARFLDPHTVQVGDERLRAKSFLLTTGARPTIPDVAGLADVPYLTHETIFDNDRLPRRMVVIGSGPIGTELSQAYARLGAQVTTIGERLLPKDDPEAAAVIERVLLREGVRLLRGRAQAARRDGDEIVVTAGSDGEELRCDLLLVAAGRAPCVAGLDLDRAFVRHSARGIEVDDKLRTSAAHIYAAGDVVGGLQFTHLAGWQAFQAARNALLPGSSSGHSEIVPWVTYTDPEVAQIGETEGAARARLHDAVQVSRVDLGEVDRAVCEGDDDGFLKLIHRADGTLLGATLVASRAGEAITELILAMGQGLRLKDLAATIHAYPTYSSAVQQLAARGVTASLLSGTSGKLIRGLSRLLR